jgi:hypothetical protein
LRELWPITHRLGIFLAQGDRLGNCAFQVSQQQLPVLWIGHEQIEAATELLVLAELLCLWHAKRLTH